MILLLCAIHRLPITITMTCSVCHQKGHNKRTCELNTKVATTGKYAGLTAVQIEAIFAERERKNYEELVAPIIAPKLACADCGQVETECHLERLVGGKVMCCDCLYPENQEDDDETVSVVSEDTCECCGRPYDHRNPHRQSEMCDCVQNDDGTLSRPEEVPELPCPDCRRWFDEGKERCKSCDYKFDGEEEDEDEMFECCGCGKLDDRDWMLNTRYDDYYCEKCWDNVPKELHPYIEGLDDQEVSVCEECGVPETDECRPDCAYQARRQREEEEEHRTRVSPTRDQLIALGKYKLAKFQIGKQE